MLMDYGAQMLHIIRTRGHDHNTLHLYGLLNRVGGRPGNQPAKPICTSQIDLVRTPSLKHVGGLILDFI